jgi:hypothetical protein
MRTRIACILFLGGCSMLSTEPDSSSIFATAENNPAFHARLLEIAAGYESYARVDDELHWAPTLCRMPKPSTPRRSASMNLDTHGKKLYYVFAKDRDAYLSRQGKTPAISGQAVVKESWTVEEVPAGTAYDMTQSPVRYLREDEHLFHAQQKSGLFIMYRLDPATPETDSGWVYGTVTGDGQVVTSSGRVQSCMGCHKQAPHERLFGIDYHGA